MHSMTAGSLRFKTKLNIISPQKIKSLINYYTQSCRSIKKFQRKPKDLGVVVDSKLVFFSAILRKLPGKLMLRFTSFFVTYAAIDQTS